MRRMAKLYRVPDNAQPQTAAKLPLPQLLTHRHVLKPRHQPTPPVVAKLRVPPQHRLLVQRPPKSAGKRAPATSRNRPPLTPPAVVLLVRQVPKEE